MIDTANAYMNEEAVGKALKKAINEGIVTREEVFVSTKIWATLYENENAVDDTLKRLDLDYVDLLFIHQPAGNYMAGYRMLEKAYKDGKAKSLGISNFEGEKLEKLLADSEIKPHVIQMEAHATRMKLLIRCAKRSILAEVDGHSDSLGELESLADNCTEIENFIIENLNGKLYCLSGFSMGGTMAVEIVGRGNVRISKVLLDAAFLTRMGVLTKLYENIFCKAISRLQRGKKIDP